MIGAKKCECMGMKKAGMASNKTPRGKRTMAMTPKMRPSPKAKDIRR